MQLALDKAWEYQLLTYPNPAVAAVIVIDAEILAIKAHQKAGTSHAEVLALLSAYEKISKTKINFDKYDAQLSHSFLLKLPKNTFAKCSIYVTLEPCSHIGQTPSCASLLNDLKLKEILIGTKDPIVDHSGGSHMLKNVTVGVLEKECKDLIEPFVIWQDRAFVLFKIAQTNNGRIGGGYLSSKSSLAQVHQLREACNSLLVGGNTVRIDKPTLDCRFTGARAPDIKIYTKEDNFDRDIPLFSITNRDIEIVDNLDFLAKPSFVLVEGGEGMLKALDNRIDWFLHYQTPKLSSNEISYNIDMDLEFLHTDKKDIDLTIWSRQLGN